MSVLDELVKSRVGAASRSLLHQWMGTDWKGLPTAHQNMPGSTVFKPTRPVPDMPHALIRSPISPAILPEELIYQNAALVERAAGKFRDRRHKRKFSR